MRQIVRFRKQGDHLQPVLYHRRHHQAPGNQSHRIPGTSPRANCDDQPDWPVVSIAYPPAFNQAARGSIQIEDPEAPTLTYRRKEAARAHRDLAAQCGYTGNLPFVGPVAVIDGPDRRDELGPGMNPGYQLPDGIRVAVNCYFQIAWHRSGHSSIT